MLIFLEIICVDVGVRSIKIHSFCWSGRIVRISAVFWRYRSIGANLIGFAKILILVLGLVVCSVHILVVVCGRILEVVFTWTKYSLRYFLTHYA